jgi:undecaprenyl diphosphate synthase
MSKSSRTQKSSGPANDNLPRHVGLIMDGNRRWAVENKVAKYQGHRVGADRIKKIADYAFEKGIEYVSAYAFSTENWKRTKDEVEYLMDLVLKLATNELAELDQKGYRTIFLGTEEGVDPKIVKAIRSAEKITKNNTNGTLIFCFNYGGYQEIVDATRAIIEEGIPAKDVTEKTIEEHLYWPEIPPIDLLIRTSGELRISNFMLWRVAYSEFIFDDAYWPDYSEAKFDNALKEYARRNRRFGADPK